MLAEEFNRTFREEHRAVRDALLDLVDAFRAGDLARARQLLERIAALAGPHFRYEEESLYPALVAIFGKEYVVKLLEDHDGAIATSRTLVGLAQRPSLSQQETNDAIRLVRTMLPHVSDCDGLSIMVERLDEPKVQQVLHTREQSLAAGLDLFAWADGVRRRPVLVA
ncbi:MAG: hemerythrin domain-containing protein [Chloroflexota bacterium]|nr:hemerythrin domain-containing protein [Chloroflexota bacterium]